MQNNESLAAIARGDVSLADVDFDAVSDMVDTSAETTLMGTAMSPWSIGIAGLLLVVSSIASGWRMSVFAAIATVVILLGPALGVPALPLPGGMGAAWIVAALAGVLIYVPGWIGGASSANP